MADNDIEAKIAAGPAGGSGAAQPVKRFIGPQPDDYVAQRPTVTGTSGSAANFRSVESGDTRNLYSPTGGVANVSYPQRYAEGTEFTPRMLSPERIAQLQSALVTAGLIGKKQQFRIGVWDETSSKAYRDVLAYANQGGIDADEALSELTWNAQNGLGKLINSDGSSADGGGGARQGRVQALTPAVTLEEQVQQSARQRLGRKLRKNEVEKFISIYGGIEKTANAQELNAAEATGTGKNMTVTAAPTVDVAASQFMDNQFAQEEAGVNTLGFLDVIKNMVGG